MKDFSFVIMTSYLADLIRIIINLFPSPIEVPTVFAFLAKSITTAAQTFVWVSSKFVIIEIPSVLNIMTAMTPWVCLIRLNMSSISIDCNEKRNFVRSKKIQVLKVFTMVTKFSPLRNWFWILVWVSLKSFLRVEYSWKPWNLRASLLQTAKSHLTHKNNWSLWHKSILICKAALSDAGF